ncbi:thermonuclease family protein [Entomomonas sp. E2T0]|uniref:thermonuclease family protein n=1 Tax=Entomomonas sp. E2T0 TaxID=2930213 RepID=UPI0022281F81|nr:thermonuclease family protein [Entomomonas sp. E2T0]UYZ83071.1 thermonuclease family protein [Entomomonas sp. E2T0]
MSDGDTITCLTTQKEQIKVRLYQIDAPEKGQDFGNRSKQALSDLIFNKEVSIRTHGKDKYRRILGTIYYKTIVCSYPAATKSNPSCTIKKDINLSMIQLGMAWYYPFTKKNGSYDKEQAIAKHNKVGLWSQKAIAPWEFRKSKKVKNK